MNEMETWQYTSAIWEWGHWSFSTLLKPHENAVWEAVSDWRSEVCRLRCLFLSNPLWSTRGAHLPHSLAAQTSGKAYPIIYYFHVK